jgi:predicted porin
MKRKIFVAAWLAAFCASAQAQSSVTLFGLIDGGIDYVNNSGGHAVFQMASGVIQGSRWGLKGIEDIGGGTRIVFQLENGFNLFNGKLGQGGLGFGRQAWVGATNDNVGTLMMGRMYDPLVDVIQPTTFNGQGGAFFSHPSDLDNTDDGFRVNNSIKYVSPRWHGLAAEAMYAFGGVAGSFGRNSTIAAGASLQTGSVYLGAAYFFAKNPATQFPDGNFQPNNPASPDTSATGIMGFVGSPSSMQTIGAGGTYSFSLVQIGADFTNVRFEDANGLPGNLARFNNYEAWAKVFVSPFFIVGGGYTFTEGKISAGDLKPRYNQFNAMLDYFFSKRTDVYLMSTVQHASGGAMADVYQAFAGNQSSTRTQIVERVGIRHKF